MYTAQSKEACILDVVVVNVFSKGFDFLGFDLDLGVIHISGPVARCSSSV